MWIDLVLGTSLWVGSCLPVGLLLVGAYQLNRSTSNKTDPEPILDSLEHMCDDLLKVFPLSSQDRDGVENIIRSLFLSESFRDQVKSPDRNPSNIAGFMIQAASSLFTPEEQTYIKSKVSALHPQSSSIDLLGAIRNLKND